MGSGLFINSIGSKTLTKSIADIHEYFKMNRGSEWRIWDLYLTTTLTVQLHRSLTKANKTALIFPCYNNTNAPTPYRKERGRRYMYVYVPLFLSQILNQDIDVLGFAQAAQGAFLDLAHTLAGEVE